MAGFYHIPCSFASLSHNFFSLLPTECKYSLQNPEQKAGQPHGSIALLRYLAPEFCLLNEGYYDNNPDGGMSNRYHGRGVCILRGYRICGTRIGNGLKAFKGRRYTPTKILQPS
jgi:hypothetical protein